MASIIRFYCRRCIILPQLVVEPNSQLFNLSLMRRFSQNTELVRVIGNNGENLGLMSKEKAEDIAIQSQLLLVEVAKKNDNKNIENDVFKITDKAIGKKKSIPNAKVSKVDKNERVKEITLKSSIDRNDLLRKAKKLEEFLENDYNVVIRITKPRRSNVLPKATLEKLLSSINSSVKEPSRLKESEKFLRCMLSKDVQS